MDYPLSLSTQLKQHLRSLRKARGLTQARLAQLLGVGQSRVADIEADPGAVSLDQLLKVLAVLDAQIVLREKPSPISAVPASESPPSANASADGDVPDDPKGVW